MYFLDQVAKQLSDSFGTSLARHCLVFPNRRAGLFLMKYLAAKAGKPMWAPRILTINELFIEASGLVKASDEGLVFELYRIHRTLAKKEETFDSFYFWGEMLLNDFDDIDKHLVDAGALFSNISDLHDIDEKFGGLTDEQMEIIRQFIRNFRAGSESSQKNDFEFNWSLLYPLYSGLRQSLQEKGQGYEGMIFRNVDPENNQGDYPLLSRYEKYHFIGFNALNGCEKRVLRYLKREGKALFYWDYEDNDFFTDDPRAGQFVIPNMKDFGQDLKEPEGEAGPGTSDRKNNSPRIRILDIPSDAGQAKLLPGLLSQLKHSVKPGEEHRTAVILADENLLPVVLSSIPEEFGDVNVTMGYPFGMTPVYSLMRALMDVQERPVKYGETWLLDFRKVLPVLANPLVTRVIGNVAADKSREIIRLNNTLVSQSLFADNEFLSLLFTITADARSLCQYLSKITITISTYLNELSLSESDSGSDPVVVKDPLTPEFLYRANQVINRLEPLLSDSSVTITREIFIRLADRIFREIKVPFRGEPLKGLQVMGLLESRALDFDNIIMLSANEGYLPRPSAGSSYIPYSLREAFGLPTISHNDSIYSYYFTRLLSRAHNLTFVYNSSAEGLKTGEMSRFLLRLKYSNRYNPEYVSAFTRMHQRVGVPEVKPRTESDIAILEEKYLSGETPAALSPSAINTWLNCTMKFYYAYVCGLRESERIITGIDPARFGTILHEVVNHIYQPFKNQIVSQEIIERLQNDRVGYSTIIDDVLRKLWYGGTGAPVTGTGLVTADIAGMFLRKVFDIDRKQAPFTIVELEESFNTCLQISYKGKPHELIIGGKIDRIDEKDGIRRLIDYKTGSAVANVQSIEDLFNSDNKKMNDAMVQTMVYCVIMSDKTGYGRLRPVIYGLRGRSSEAFDDRLRINEQPVEEFSEISVQFTSLLRETLVSIFDTSRPFIMTSILERCNYCPYANLCQR